MKKKSEKIWWEKNKISSFEETPRYIDNSGNINLYDIEYLSN